MAGLEITGVQAGQSTTGATGGQPKRVQKSQQIIIKFAELPENMRTKKVRDFYDKDCSGFLESNNANGQNEVALMQQAFGIDLSKYKSNLTSVDMQSNGVKSGRIGKTHAYSISELKDRIYVYEGANGETSLYYDIDYNLYAKTTRKGDKIKNSTRYFKNGNTISSDDGKVYKLRDKNGNLIATETRNSDGSYNLSVIQRKQLTSGKNVLTSETTYVNEHKKYAIFPKLESSLSNIFDFPENTNVTIDKSFKQTKIEYKLNGKPVQAKPIGKGRYEVTDKDGNVFYVSHDGVYLKPEYVRSNP